MRTTLDLDDDLLASATRQFPAGTPKTVVIEECLRRALAASPPQGRPGLPAEVSMLVARGVLVPAARSGPPPQGSSDTLPAGQLEADLARDREDR